MYETGHFAALWQKLADRLGLKTEIIAMAGTCRQLGFAHCLIATACKPS